jgi:hypothetical protein
MPVGRRKCGKIKDLEKLRDCSAIVKRSSVRVEPGRRRRRWPTALLLAAAFVAAAGCAVVLALDALNRHVSRCSDQSAPEYIGDRTERARACGRE